jgi:23S rRNA (cytosine1962-C5)-methyltransferase
VVADPASVYNQFRPMLQDIPAPSRTRLAIRLHPRAERAVRRGHPWVFDHGIKHQRREGRAGDLAVLFDHANRFLAIGLYDPASPIRVRVLHVGAPATIDREWFAARIAEAHGRRLPLLEQETTGYRVVHGGNDGLPGLVADRYGKSLVLKLYTAAWIPYLPDVLAGLHDTLAPERIVLRLSRTVQAAHDARHGLSDGQVLHGLAADAPVLFRENGLLFETDLVKGHKTGFFLDQRDNRIRVEQLAANRTVLNVFAYTGGFSVYAARGGAAEITSLDISRLALDAAERNFSHNRQVEAISAARHRALAGDAFTLLEELRRRGDRYDLVILDPPAFAKAHREIDRAIRSYQRLTRLGLGLLSPGGTLVSASCSSRIGMSQFVEVVGTAAQGVGRHLQVFEVTAHALDHPISFPEAAYLKCLFATAP